MGSQDVTELGDDRSRLSSHRDTAAALVPSGIKNLRAARMRSLCRLLKTGSLQFCMELPHKIKHGAALGPSESASGNMSEETPNTDSKECMPL